MYGTETFELRPQYRNPTDPDENGVNVMEFRYDAPYFTMRLGDRWAYEYNGERLRVRVELFKDRFLSDKSLGVKYYEFDTASDYEIRFTRDEFNGNDKSVGAEEANEPETRANKKYYVKWAFQRLGRVSTDRFIKKDRTEKIEAE